MTTGHQICSCLPTNFGNPSGLNHDTTHRGLQSHFAMPPFPVSAGYQTCLGPNVTRYTAPNDCQNQAMHPQYYTGNQVPFLHSQSPFATPSSLQLAANCQAAADSIHQNPVSFGHNTQPCRVNIDWEDSHAVSMEIRKLKEAWREGVGIKKYRRSKKPGYCETSRMHSASGEGPDRLVFNGEDFGSKAEAMVCDPAKEYEDSFNGESSSSNSFSISPMLNDSIVTDKHDDVTTLEELEKLELLLSPDVTPTWEKPATKTRRQQSPVNVANEKYHLPDLSPIYNKVKPPISRPLALEEGSKLKRMTSSTCHMKGVASLCPVASQLPTSKETPTSKRRTSSVNLFNGVASLRPATPGLPILETPAVKGGGSSTSLYPGVISLRPPKPIAKSSKPVTQPVPFNLVGETVAQKLKLQREQRRQRVGGIA